MYKIVQVHRNWSLPAMAGREQGQSQGGFMTCKRTSAILALAMMFAVAGCSTASRQSLDPEQPVEPTTVDIQGATEWKRSPHMLAYYETTKATFANGTDIDVDAYEARAFEIFREFARANGRSEQG